MDLFQADAIGTSGLPVEGEDAQAYNKESTEGIHIRYKREVVRADIDTS